MNILNFFTNVIFFFVLSLVLSLVLFFFAKSTFILTRRVEMFAQKYSHMSVFLISALQAAIAVLVGFYHKSFPAVVIIFIYPVTLIWLEKWKNSIKK